MNDLSSSITRLIIIFIGAQVLLVPSDTEAQFGYAVNSPDTGTITITNYTGSGGIVNVPTNINGLVVTGIGYEAFLNNINITILTIPGSVTTIDDYAFGEMHLLGSVTIPGSVSNLGGGLFGLCAALTNATLSNGLTGFGPDMFARCTSLTTLAFPTNITNLSAGAFADTALTSFVIPPTVTTILDEAFESTPLMTNVTLPATLTGIGQFSFDGCGITSIAIPNGVTYLGYCAFNNCANLTNATIPSSVATVGDFAFASCPSLTYVTISSGVPSLGFETFEDSSNLRGVFCQGNAPTTTGEQGDSTTGPVLTGDTNVTVYYLAGTTGWSNTYQGVPAMEWNPAIASKGMHNGQFGVTVTGNTNIPIQLQACTNLNSSVWTPLTNVSLTNGSFYYSEPVQSNSAARFYRVVFP